MIATEKTDPPKLEVPSEADWRSEPWSLDVEHAYQTFAGKTMVEAIALFEENALHYQEDVMFMPSRCFGFYVRAYANYIMGSASQNDSDGANCFIGLIKRKVEFAPEDVKESWDAIEPALGRLATHQDFYDAEVDIYGNFMERIRHLAEHGFRVGALNRSGD